jgi:enamine deaminase RidA (YjgF/YER057c/UK114 family)
MKELCGSLKKEFHVHFREPKSAKSDIVSHGGNRLVEHVKVGGLPPLGGCAHASVASGRIHVAGVIGCELPDDSAEDLKARKTVDGGIMAETYRCCQVIEHILQACLADWADIVHFTAHVADLTDAKVEEMEAAMGLFCKERRCPSAARSVVGCSRLRLGASVQIEALAVTSFMETAGYVSTAKSSKSASAPQSSPGPLPPPGLLDIAGTPPLIALVGGSATNSALSTPAVPTREPFSALNSLTDKARQAQGASELESAQTSSAETPSPPRLPASSAASTTPSPQKDSSSAEKDQDGTGLALETLQTSEGAVPRVAKADAGERQSRRQRGRAAKEAASLAATKEAEALALAASIAAPAKASAPTPLSAGATRFVPSPEVKERLPAESESAPQGEKPQEEPERKCTKPFSGDGRSVLLEDVSQQPLCPRTQRQEAYTAAWQVVMKSPGVYKTLRLGPSVIPCHFLVEGSSWAARAKGPWPVTWSYEFDVTITKTEQSFINIGLVEWTAQAKDPKDPSSYLLRRTSPSSSPPSLTQVMGLSSSEEWVTEPSWQQWSENPRQMMLGCRKGVKWYGDRRQERLFGSDICEGSTLRFRCDHVFDASGRAIQMKLWLLPSGVVFRYRGNEAVQLAKPLFEWPDSRWHDDKLDKMDSRARIMWVPAVTLYTKEDSVIFSWSSATDSQAGA